MNRSPDVDLVLRDYFADDGLTAPDYILDVVEGRISRQPRRGSWRLPWRLRSMNSNLKLLAGAAAAIVLAVVAWQLLPGRTDGPGDRPSATPSPTAAPSPVAIPPLPEGTLTAGTYRLQPRESAPSLSLDATVPAGWIGGPPCCLGGPVGESNGPAGIGLAFLTADDIFSDPCHWNVDGSGPFQPGDVEVGPSVDELAEALAASSAYEATTPTDVTIGGFAGKRVDLELPSGECDTLDGNGVYIVFGGRDGYEYAQGDGSHWQISIVDVAGTRLIAALFSYAGTSAADLSAGQAIVDTLVITP